MIAVRTAIRIDRPYKIPPISPKDTGTLFRVSTKSKKLYKEINAIADKSAVEKKIPPL